MSFDVSRADKFFTPAEMDTLPEPGKILECDEDKLPKHCCLGSFSMAGVMTWASDVCVDADFMRIPIGHDGE